MISNTQKEEKTMDEIMKEKCKDIVESLNRTLLARCNFYATNFDLFSFCRSYDKIAISKYSMVAKSRFPIGYINENVAIKYI
jgi:hypothetical protein